jgi:hypothetical protein
MKFIQAPLDEGDRWGERSTIDLLGDRDEVSFSLENQGQPSPLGFAQRADGALYGQLVLSSPSPTEQAAQKILEPDIPHALGYERDGAQGQVGSRDEPCD